MVKGFIIYSADTLTILQIKRAMANLPNEMTFNIISERPLKVDITPKTDRVKMAMYQDSLEGKKGNKIKEHYLNTFTPFLKIYVKNMAKLEVYPYD